MPYGLRFHLGFLHWLAWTGKRVDVLSQWDLEHVSSARALRRAYDLVVFAGHHEYVTTREYDLVERYRDRGGNLMFLCSNSYFWRVVRHGNVLEKAGRWRGLDRPEASLIGVAVHRVPAHAAPAVGRAAHARRALVPEGNRPAARVAVRTRRRRDRPRREGVPGSRAGARRDPEPLRAREDGADDLLRDAQGARVFAAGAFHFTRAITTDFVVWQLLENVWARLTR